MNSVLLLTFLSIVICSAGQGKRQVKLNAEQILWLDDDGVNALIREYTDFMDVTNRVFPQENQKHGFKEIPTSIRFQATVEKILESLNLPRMERFLAHFCGYHNRYYQSPNGVAAAEWLLAQVNSTIATSNYGGSAVVNAFTHSWPQKSIIARIQGSDPALKNQVVILGAHLDSINSTHPADGLAQGADDNGSGSGVLLESWRLLLESGFIPRRSIEFHWYAAEEVGLLGSLDIAETYFNNGVHVVSMVNYDVLGYYVKGREEVALYTDYGDPQLLHFMELVVGSYLDFGFFHRTCSGPCSDHVSWHEFGFPALFNKEAVSNPYMHTTNDTISLVNFRQLAEFVKLAIGYAVEVAEPN